MVYRRHDGHVLTLRAAILGERQRLPSRDAADKRGFRVLADLAKSFGVYQSDGEGELCVRVRFSPQVARYVSESTWHASQQLTPQRDGSLLAEFRLGSTEEVKRWLLGFGRHAEVLVPEELREEIAEELKELLSTYGDQRPRPSAKEV